MDDQPADPTGVTSSDDPPPDQDDDDEDESDDTTDDQAEDVIMAVTGGRWHREGKRRRWSDGQDRMNEELSRYGAGHHVTEIYLPPRVAVWADRMRLAPGLAFDLTQKDPNDGKPWDFNDPNKASTAKR